MSKDREQLIAARAYQLWEEEGRPHGAHERHWIQAVRDVEVELATPKKKAAARPKAAAVPAAAAKAVVAAKAKAPATTTKVAAVPARAMGITTSGKPTAPKKPAK